MGNRVMGKVKAPLVTVYIPNHNYGRFIDQAIKSVLSQTLQDFELIIIDDGSTDNSEEIIKRYVGHDKIITIFQKKKGLNVTNNIALRASRGSYIMRLDADDYLDENALSVLAGMLERNPDTGLVFPDYFIVDEGGIIQELVRRHDFSQVTMLDQPAHGACTLIRRECLMDLGGYNESYSCQDGYELWLRFTKRYRVQNVNLPLFYYRKHSRSLTCDEDRLLDTRARIIEEQTRMNGRQLKGVAVIPVRGRSIDPSSPALRLLGGRPLIDWTLETALQAKRLEGVMVTSPDQDLLSYVSAKYKGKVITVKRDRELAMPNTFIEDTVFHALQEYSLHSTLPGAVVLLYIECPFRSPRYVDTAIDVMELFGSDTVVGVRPDTDVFYRHNGAGLEPLRKDQVLRLEREDLYREVGQLRVIRRDFLEQTRQVSGGKVGHVVLDAVAALRLRSDWDWELAELQASKKGN
jgi:glycosyltransferase involved in cell wall biosynthesis